jgi:hypothetical protein
VSLAANCWRITLGLYRNCSTAMPCLSEESLRSSSAIASIRRILVISLEAATLTKEGAWATEGSSGIFHSSMIELGLLGLLVLVLVVSHGANTSSS